MNENSRVRRIFLFSSCAAAAANVDLVDADAVTAAAVFKAAEDDIVVLMLLLDVVVTSGVTNFILFYFFLVEEFIIASLHGGTAAGYHMACGAMTTRINTWRRRGGRIQTNGVGPSRAGRPAVWKIIQQTRPAAGRTLDGGGVGAHYCSSGVRVWSRVRSWLVSEQSGGNVAQAHMAIASECGGATAAATATASSHLAIASE